MIGYKNNILKTNILFLNYKQIYMDEEQEWLKKAKRDFEAAKVNFREEFYDISAFLLHQCVEKLLKAFYIKRFRKLIKTHNLVFLAEKLKIPKKFLDVCDELNPFYIEARYPPLFVVEKYTKDNISKLIENVGEILEWIKKEI